MQDNLCAFGVWGYVQDKVKYLPNDIADSSFESTDESATP